ncbi:fimbrillin family protein [uncultured Parabacteroides sp.]|uniref:fimbrillin family protein n=1 Tax=uncultured Parabacteroides sp. TaxID=512312 RepID=UPI00259269F3|nr:fimbrillin family protein [uncultured Parabacteroides sp.]
MMRKRITINESVVLAVCWLTVAGFGCSDEMVLTSSDHEGEPVNVQASIDGFSGVLTENGSKTIAADNGYDRSTFVDNDKIRITKKYGEVADNPIEYTLSGTTWTPPSGKALTLQAGATYQAVYPTNYTSIQSSQSVAANYLKSNLLQTEILPASSETIDFTFKHVNTKLTLIFKPATGGPAFSGNFSFQVEAAGLLTGGNSSEIVTLYRPDNSAYIWHGIVYPKGTATDITVSVTYNDVTYQTTLNGCGLAAGSQYEYTLTIQNNILVPVGSEIKNWTPKPTHTGTLT